MPSERLQRQLDRLLDEAEAAVAAGDWPRVLDLADDALALDPENADATAFRDAAARRRPTTPGDASERGTAPTAAPARPAVPPSLAGGRYAVRRFLGEGGRKKIYRPNLASHAAPDGTVTIMFSDVEDSTAMNEALGDAKWMELLRDHNALIEHQVAAHGGYVVKSMGDGYMAAFASARKALQCALAIQAHFAPQNEEAGSSSAQSSPPIRVRIGLHTGEPVRHRDDFFGTDVNLAGRVAAAAQGGEVLVSSLLRDLLAPGGDFAFDDGRDVELKGLAGRHRIHVVSR